MWFYGWWVVVSTIFDFLWSLKCILHTLFKALLRYISQLIFVIQLCIFATISAFFRSLCRTLVILGNRSESSRTELVIRWCYGLLNSRLQWSRLNDCMMDNNDDACIGCICFIIVHRPGNCEFFSEKVLAHKRKKLESGKQSLNCSLLESFLPYFVQW